MSETITPAQPTGAPEAAPAAPAAVVPASPATAAAAAQAAVAAQAAAPPVEAQADPVAPPAETIEDVRAKLAEYKKIAREQEKRAKENADARKQLDAIEDANKTELEKALARADAAEKAAAESAIETLRATKSSTSGVSIDLIPAGTEEQMDAAIAAAIAFKDAAVAEATKRRPSPAAPAEIVTAANGSDKVTQITSREELKSMSPGDVLTAHKEGRLDELLGKIT